MDLIRLDDHLQCGSTCQNLSFASMCELYSGRSWCENQVYVFFQAVC